VIEIWQRDACYLGFFVGYGASVLKIRKEVHRILHNDEHCARVLIAMRTPTDQLSILRRTAL